MKPELPKRAKTYDIRKDMDYPLKRAGTPEDIAYAAVYLASDESPHTTGENLVVDTGITLGRSAKLQAERGAMMQKAISGD